MKKLIWMLLLMAMMAIMVGAVVAAEHQDQHGTAVMGAKAVAKNESPTANAYPIDHCVVSGEELGSMGDPVTKRIDGREVRFCCQGCVSTFEKDKAKYFKLMDEAIVVAQKPNYPISTCVVSGEELGGKIGDPVDFVIHNRLIRLCCDNCVSAVKKNPDKYLSILDEAIKRATEVEVGE